MSISESSASAFVTDTSEIMVQRPHRRNRPKEREDFSGRIFGEFSLRDCIGEGGFGAVYRCEQSVLRSEAVVKVLHQRLEPNNVALQRFMREVSLASRLDHQYTARVHAFGIEYNDGLFWIAMEMVHGTALNRWLRDHGPVPLDQFVPLFECVAEVVQAAHDRGIVHRDLKPSNIMVTDSHRKLVPKLLDFGLAKLFDGRRLQLRHDSKRTFRNRPVESSDSSERRDSISNSAGEISPVSNSNPVIGTPAYMSPEQWNHPDTVGPASDLYALGIVAYEAITGRRPFIAATLSEYAELHSEAAIPRLDKGLPRALDDWFHRALAKRPETRWGSALELAATLRAAANLKGESDTAPEPQALPSNHREAEPMTAATEPELTAEVETQVVADPTPRRFTVNSSAAVRIAVYSATGSKLGVGDGVITLSLIPGLYRVHLRRCGLIRELLVEHVQDTELHDPGPSLDGPAPLNDGPISSPYGEAARQLSLSNTYPPLGDGSHSSRLFLFIRRKSSKSGPFHVPSEPITIHDRTGRKLVSLDREAVLCDDELGYAALSCRVVPGMYRIRAVHSHREVAVTIPENRAAHVFLADTGTVRIEDLRISLVILGCAFDPESRISQAMESVLAALRSTELTFPADARSLLPEAVQQDLCFGIAVAHQLWRCEEIVTFDQVMKHLKPHSQIPDIAILAHLRPQHPRTITARLLPWRYRAFHPSFAVPPLLRASQTMVMTRREFDVSNVAADSIFARATATEFHDSVWFTWSARAWDERWIEPTVESLRELGHRSAAAIAPMIGLPPQTVERAIMRLDSRPTFEREPFAHLKDIRIPGYALGEVIGRGTHGMVFKATHMSDGRPVALKLIPLVRGGGQRARIEKALELLQRLDHPGLVTYHRWGVTASDTALWIDMELCYRSALDILLSGNLPLTPSQVIQIAMEALDTLGSLHRGGIVHSNIKPSELLMRENGSLALADPSVLMGFAAYEPLVSVTTPSFVAPEQLIPTGRATAASDVWSMAATLYFLLTLDSPRDEHSGGTEVEAVSKNTAISIMERCTLVPREVARCIDCALSRDVPARPKNGIEFRERLMRAHRLDETSAQSRESSNPDIRSRRARRDASPAQHGKQRWRSHHVPALTIASHPVGDRVGERYLLAAVAAGHQVSLSRNQPNFVRPGRALGAPLGDPFLSRRPIRFAPGPDGGVEVFVDQRTRVIAGSAIDGSAVFTRDDIAAGVALELAARVVLVLHRVEPKVEDAAEPLGMVGASAGVRRVRTAIERIADLAVPVLIRGETGTGKKLVARALHDRGPRCGGPFVSVNLGAIPREFAAAELFGTVPGADTGAPHNREGLFLTAHGGTLFLDEVGEAPTEIQLALLRALETGEIYPVGAEKPVAIQVRMIAATDADLEDRIREGRFVAPLLHRLAGFEIRLPPLRERREDIGPLLYHFAREELAAIGEADRLSPLDPYARPWLPALIAAQLVQHAWPGNIRQLRNVTRQLVIRSRGLQQLRLDPGVADELAIDTGTRVATDIRELTWIWRPRPTASVLLIKTAEGEPFERLVFKIEDPERTYFIGRTEQRSDGKRNDFALPKAWSSISRDQGTLMTRDGNVVLTNTSTKDNVFVRGERVPSGGTRCLRHGDYVQIGRCLGLFKDGRYYSAAMAATVDWRTGLLSRIGLIAEMGKALASGEPRLLFAIHCPADVMDPPRGPAAADFEHQAVTVAAALHRHNPSNPIARIGVDVVMLLATEDAVAAMAAVAHRVSGARSVSGFLKLHGTANRALPRLEACLGALSRIAIAGREPAGPEDLSRYALVPTPLDAFAEHAHPLFDADGGAVLFVLGDLERLKRMVPDVLSVLELELMEMLGAHMGPRDIVSLAGPGLLLFGAPGDVERFAREVAAAWHARGPVTANAFEIDRYLSTYLLTISDLDDLVQRAAALARGEVAALDASGLPAPLALGAIAVDEARDTIERARAIVHLAELSWQLLAFILVASARGVGAQDTIRDAGCDAVSEPRSWPAPWRSVARTAARRLEGQSPRTTKLASVVPGADREGSFREAMDVIAAAAESLTMRTPDRERIEVSMPRLEKAVREIFTAFGPLRGWTLVAIVGSEFVDVNGTAQRVEYIDYTGPSARGVLQRVTAVGFRALGPFAYLVRWDEGLAIAIEPFVRRARDNELFLAVGMVSEPGKHCYRSVSGTHEIEQTVTAKQLGISTG